MGKHTRKSDYFRRLHETNPVLHARLSAKGRDAAALKRKLDRESEDTRKDVEAAVAQELYARKLLEAQTVVQERNGDSDDEEGHI